MKEKVEVERKPPVPAKTETGESGEESVLLAGEIFWLENKQKILTAVAVVAIGVAGYLTWSFWQNYIRERASLAFATAQSPDDWVKVAKEFPNTPAAINSRLLLAAALRDSGQIIDSNTIYQEVLKQKDSTGVASAAALGLAYNQLVAKNGAPEQEVIDAFQAAAAQFPNSYIVPYAMLTQGELLLRADNPNRASQIFRAILADYPRSLSARVASGELQRIAATQSNLSPPMQASESAKEATPSPEPSVQEQPVDSSPNVESSTSSN